jgi:hypothetical protein
VDISNYSRKCWNVERERAEGLVNAKECKQNSENAIRMVDDRQSYPLSALLFPGEKTQPGQAFQ